MSKKPNTAFLSIILLLIVLVWPEVALAAGDQAGMSSSGLLSNMAQAFGWGVMTSLTPCVYPMIPIVLGVFGAKDESVSRVRAVVLATCYVFGMGITFSTLGVTLGLLNKQFGTILANPWVVYPLVGFYLVLATSMFGAFELTMPASLQGRLTRVGGRGFAGAFGMGLVGGLTAAPCTGPFVAIVLAQVAKGGAGAATGGIVLFTYAMGIGLLFWVLAAFAVAMPKSGRWMEAVKSVGGIALIAVGIYFLQPIHPELAWGKSGNTFLGIAAAIAALGIALGSVTLSFHGTTAVKIRKAVAVGVTVVGLMGIVNGVLTADRKLPWMHSEVEAFAAAKESGKGVMVDFAASWCLPCKEMEVQTFADATVFADITDNFVPLKVDVTNGTAADEAMQAKYSAPTLPSIVFVDASGNELGRVSKIMPPEEFRLAMESMRARTESSAP